MGVAVAGAGKRPGFEIATCDFFGTNPVDIFIKVGRMAAR
jgi:hypothetical protein